MYSCPRVLKPVIPAHSHDREKAEFKLSKCTILLEMVDEPRET